MSFFFCFDLCRMILDSIVIDIEGKGLNTVNDANKWERKGTEALQLHLNNVHCISIRKNYRLKRGSGELCVVGKQCLTLYPT